MMLEHTQYRSYLKSVFAEKQGKNRAFSMRSFAKVLGLTQSAVSQMLAGKKNLSMASAVRISQALGLNDLESEYFCLLVQFESSKNPLVKESLLRKINTFNLQKPVRELSTEYFRLISDWYHTVIRNMTELDGFEFSAGTISHRLGITRTEVEAAIDRLQRLELIEPDATISGRYKKTSDHVVVQSEFANQALRDFHRQMLEKAIDSLQSQTPAEKIVGSETFAIAEDALPEARIISEEFFQQMRNLGQRAGKKTQVYHLGVQFFNVTKEGK